MKKNNKNLIITVIALIVAMLLATFSSLISFAADSETETLPTLSVTMPSYDASGFYYPNSNRMLYITFTLDKDPGDNDVIVYFHAEDRTAVSAAGDYFYNKDVTAASTKDSLAATTHDTSTITLNSSNYKAGVTIGYYVESTDLSTYTATQLCCNYFIFVVDEVKNATTTFTTAKCRMAYKYKFYAENNGENIYAWGHSWEQVLCYVGKLKGGHDASYSNNAFPVSEQSLTNYAGLIQGGYGHLYVGAFYSWLDANEWSAYDFISTLYIGNTKIVKETIDDIWEEDYFDDDEEHTDFDEDKFISTYFNDGGHTYYQIPVSAGYTYTLAVHNNGDGVLKRWGTCNILSAFCDDIAPTYKNAYIDSSSLFTDGKIRIMLRFSEPVRTTSAYINAKLNANLNTIFRYAEGSGTNTLVFEANVNSEDLSKSNINITSVMLSDVANYKQIYDLGKNARTSSSNALSYQPINAVTLKCSIDLRSPVFAASPSKGSTDVTADKSIDVSIENFTRGIVYYCWSKEKSGDYSTEANFKALIAAGDVNDKYAGKKEVVLYDLNKTLSVTIGSPAGIDGEYYLHLLAVSKLGKVSYTTYGRVDSTGKVAGGYYFDNNAPSLTAKMDETNSDASHKYFTLSTTDSIRNITGLGEPSGIYRIGIEAYNDGDSENAIAANIWLKDSLDAFVPDSGTTTSAASIQNAKVTLEVVHVDEVLDTDNTTVLTPAHYELQVKGNGKTLKVINLSDKGYGKFYYRFYSEDVAGNIIKQSYLSVRYDTRDLFKSSWDVEDKSARQLYTELNNVTIFDINVLNSKNLVITFTDLEYDDNNIGGQHDVMDIADVYYGESLTPLDPSEYNTYFTKTQSEDGRTVSVTPKKCGFYVFEVQLDRLGSTLYGGDGYEFYVTDHSANADTKDYNYEKTVNSEKAKGNLVLNNQVRQLGTTFYYADATNKINSVAYNNCSAPASFSSASIAKEYLLFMEYQDLYLVQLNDDNAEVASLLNAQGGGSTEYKKADGQDNITASTNQTWIRYKRSSWTTNSGIEGWAYYFYCQGYTDKINISSLPAVLTSAIGTVVDYLDSFAYYTDLVSADNRDSNNAPYLKEGQIHYSAEKAYTTKTGSTFFNPATYDGDEGIYDNTVTISEKEYPIATNLQLTVNNRTHLYFIANGVITELEAKDGDYLGAIMNVGSGVYEILEIDGNGLCKFSVYIDKTAPVIGVSYTTAVEGYRNEYTLSNKFDGSVFSAKSFTITTISGEYDYFSYIAVYNNNSKKLISVYYYNEILISPVVLEDGNYYVEVCDRSGNVYYFVAQVCSEPLTYVIKVVDNAYVYVSTNRTVDQMLRYEVTCNNTLIDEPYTGSAMKYKKSGYYNIYIEDIYGFTNSTEGSFGVNYAFERPLPEITWLYANSAGSYSEYDANTTKVMSIVESISPQFLINTSRRLRFSFTGDYVYEFTGLDEDEYSYNSFGHYVTINSDKSWTLKVSYKDYPDVYAVYICTMDKTPPNISSSYKVATYGICEESDMTLASKTAQIGDIYIPKSVEFIKNGTYTNGISEGDYVTSSLINLSVTDDSGIDTVSVYKDDKLLSSYSPEDNKFTPIVLGEEGYYYIVATDVFGNESTLSFYNMSNTVATAKTDDNSMIANGTLAYGKTDTQFCITADGQFLVHVEKGDKSYFLFYTITDGTATVTRYVCEAASSQSNLKTYSVVQDSTTVLDQQGQNVTVTNPFFSKSDIAYVVNKWYHFVANDNGTVLYSENETVDGIDLYVKYDLNGNLTFRFASDEEERVSVEATFFIDKVKEPSYFKSLLSQEVTDVRLENIDGTAITTGKSGDMVRTNQAFDVVNNTLYPLSEYIVSIEMEYSSTRSFGKPTLIYPVQNGFIPFATEENGFYLVKVTNIFGNVNEYIIHRSDVFTIISYAVYDDLLEMRYTTDYDGTLKANNKIGFEAYADQAAFYLKNLSTQETKQVNGTFDNGCYYLQFSEAGKYELTLLDNFGNKVVKAFEIKKTNLIYQENFLTGYNTITNQLLEKYPGNEYIQTLHQTITEKLAAGYTSNKLTIPKIEMQANNIQYIEIIHTIYKENGDTVQRAELLYDNLSEKKVELNTSKLTKAVGNDGDGEYTVIFRDEYGSIAKKTIHYMGTPTLDVTRQIRSSATPEAQEISVIAKNGVWSNSQVFFNTTATDYIFYVEEVKISDSSVTDAYPSECPKTFAFPLSSGNGKRQYRVYYVDEYGYEYTIDVYLIRQNIEITMDDSVVLQDIDDVLTTRNNLKFTFTENSTCTYRLNSGDLMEYKEGQTLYKDGLYRFTVVDYAGNVTTKNIKKDTTCEYKFYIKESDKTLLNGDVVNVGKVNFVVLNNDTAFLSKWYLDGELQELEGQTSFSKAGKYNFIIEDKAGNKTMFEFYIITHALSFFEYTTPANYVIEAFWYDSGDGILMDEMIYVNQNGYGNTSSFTTANMGEDINGTYTVVMSSSVFAHSVDFTFTINTAAPKISLDGCEEGETTVNAITLNGCKTGDTIYVYRDGELVETKEISGSSDKLAPITEGGKYVIVVENEAGVSSTLKFTRTQIINGAGSALIIILCLAMVAGLIVGMILRNCQKVDD